MDCLGCLGRLSCLPMGTNGLGPKEAPHSPIERAWPDNVGREDQFLKDHPDWTIKRIKPPHWPGEPMTYEATDGVITITSHDLGALLNQVERALRELGEEV